MSEAGERRLDDRVLESVLAAVDDPALVCDADGAVRAWNDAFDARTVADRRLRDQAVETFLEWEGEDPVADALDGETGSGPARLEGDGRRYQVTARPVDSEGVHGAVVTFADESAADWPVAEAALAASPDTVYVVDTDCRIRAVSDRFERVTKIPTAEVVGEPLSRLAEFGVVTEETVERGREALSAVFAGEEAEVTVSLEPVIDSGSVVEGKAAPIHRGESVVGAVIVVRDVTERERVAAARRRSQERLQTILESLPVAMFVVDADGRIDHVQGFDFSELTCDRSDLLGAPIGAFAEPYGDVVAGCRRALDGEPGTATATVGERTYEAVFEPVREDGAVTGTIAVAIDVTDREERERELAATNERLDMALANTGAAVYEWDADTDRIEWYDNTVGLFDPDATRPASLAAVVDEGVHEADRDRVRAAIETAANERSELAVEFRLDRPDDDVQWVIAEGEVHESDDGSPRIVGTVRDVTDRKRRERELAEREQRLRAVIESSADPIAMQDTDGRYRVVNGAFVEVTDCSREELRGATPADVFDEETARRVERHRLDVLSTEGARVVTERVPVADGDRTVQLTVAPHYDPDGDVRGTVAIARDISELERQREELETLTAIQELVQESVRGVTTANTRAAIKQSVCDRLADSPFYEAVCIASRAASTPEITPDYTAGGASAYLEEISATVDTSQLGQGPGGTAYRTGEVQVVDDVREDPDFEPWRETALDHGFEGVAVVPLTHGSTTHGILALYTDRPDPFSDREVEGFETLGAAVGFALSAAQHRRLLEVDRVLELEYTVESEASPFIRASAEHDCRFEISDTVHARDGKVVNYLTVDGADPEVGATVARDIDNLVSLRRLEETDGPDFEVKWRESVFQYLAETGARGVRGVIENGVGRLHVEAPGDIDVRQVTDAVRRRFDDVALAAKRERERTDAPWWHAHGDIGAHLTDRQRGVLQAAYYSGYYAWPRETDAETLADSLDIATPTLLQHLRKGHRRVLEAMFDS